MVRKDVWLAAVPWNTDGGMFGFLCIGCLERRIGRRLTADDFPDDVPITSIRGIGAASVYGHVWRQWRHEPGGGTTTYSTSARRPQSGLAELKTAQVKLAGFAVREEAGPSPAGRARLGPVPVRS